MNKPDALTLVIFGASGDLTRRKLMPALYLLYKAGRLPRRFAVLGMARTSYDDDRFRTSIREGLLSFVRPDEVDEKSNPSIFVLLALSFSRSFGAGSLCGVEDTLGGNRPDNR